LKVPVRNKRRKSVASSKKTDFKKLEGGLTEMMGAKAAQRYLRRKLRRDAERRG